MARPNLAFGLAEHGASVVPGGRRKSPVDEVAGAIEATGGPNLAHTVDARQKESIEALREAVLDSFGNPPELGGWP